MIDILKTVTGMRLDPREDFFESSHGFGLAQLDLTLDDLEGSKTKVTVFNVKYVYMTLGHIDSSSLDLFAKYLWPSC